MSTERWMDKEVVVQIVHNTQYMQYMLYKMLPSHKKEWIWVSSNEVDEPRACYTKWSKSEKNKNSILMHILLLLSHFSCVQTLCDPIDGSPPGSPVPGTLQARTLEWVAISFSNAWKWKVKGKSCLTLSDPMDCSPPGSSVHGIFQARVLEWGAFSY